MKKFSLLALLLALATAPALTSCNTEPDFTRQLRELEEAQRATDDAIIQAYFTRNNINSSQYTRLTSGIYLVTLTEGSTANPLIQAGQRVTTNYVGKFITPSNENIIFDASSNNRTDCGCFTFLNGSGVIAGWSQATLLMREGDRKLIFIPSYLAYGAAGTPGISPNSPLLFDMEILDVQ